MRLLFKNPKCLPDHLNHANRMPEPFSQVQLKIIQETLSTQYLQYTALRTTTPRIPCIVLYKFLAVQGEQITDMLIEILNI